MHHFEKCVHQEKAPSCLLNSLGEIVCVNPLFEKRISSEALGHRLEEYVSDCDPLLFLKSELMAYRGLDSKVDIVCVDKTRITKIHFRPCIREQTKHVDWVQVTLG